MKWFLPKTNKKMLLSIRITHAYSLLIGLLLVVFVGLSLIFVHQNYLSQFATKLHAQMDMSQDYVSLNARSKSFDFLSAVPMLYQEMIQIGPASLKIYTKYGSSVNFDGEVASDDSLPSKYLEEIELSPLHPMRRQLHSDAKQISLIGPLLKKTDEQSYELVGFARISLSLEPLLLVMLRIAAIMIGVALILIAISSIIGYRLALHIVKPIGSLEATVHAMQGGKRHIRAHKLHDDEIGQLTDGFNHLITTLEEEERHKEVFIASVSHELRTPLTSIMGWAHTLRDPRTDDSQHQKGLQIIISECQRLSAMVDHLLDLSKLNLGELPSTLGPIDIVDIAHSVYYQLDPIMKEKQNFWHLEIPDEVKISTGHSKGKLLVVGDEMHLKQLLIILVDNAIKHSPPQSTIKLSLATDTAYTLISISDNGPGIPPELRDTIFMPFSRGHAYNSSGLGLTLAHSLALQQDATLKFESSEEKGTTFHLALKNHHHD